MLSDLLIEPDSLVATTTGLSLGLRLPWYQSLPLSTVRLSEVSVDGTPLSPAGLSFTLNGQTRPLTVMPGLTGEYWFVTDTLHLHLPLSGPRRGTDYLCRLRLQLFPPYAETLRRDNVGALRMRAR